MPSRRASFHDTGDDTDDDTGDDAAAGDGTDAGDVVSCAGRATATRTLTARIALRW
jgi:hypothetical protein